MLDSKLAAPQGFEPRYADPESAVLPLNEGAPMRVRLVSLPFDAMPLRVCKATLFILRGTPGRGQCGKGDEDMRPRWRSEGAAATLQQFPG